jgi:hypothetical protein
MDLEKRLIKLTLPEAVIDGLHFNKQEVSAVFEKQKDGWWQSEDILFMSARNVEDDNSQDILTEYLNDYRIKQQIAESFNVPPGAITVALPKEPQGIKKYHSVDCWYWLADSFSDSAACFCGVNYSGIAYNGGGASAVGGCSPAFRVAEEHKKAGVEKGYSHPGHCFKMAGWKVCGASKGGLTILEAKIGEKNNFFSSHYNKTGSSMRKSRHDP